MQTFYELLGVARTASADELRTAYYAKARRYHPDLHQDNPLADLANAELRKLNQAYEVLSDPARRAAYDAEWKRAAHLRPRPALPGGTKVLLLIVGILLLPRLIPALGRGLFGALKRPLPGIAILCAIVFVIWRATRSRKQA